MDNFKPKKFTEPAILFALTGHVFIRYDASLEYYQECLREIHDDELYRFVMKDVPRNVLENLLETIGSDTQDIDPILVQYLCSSSEILSAIKDYSDKTPYRKSKDLIEERFLTNGYMEVAPIDFKSFCEFAENSVKVNANKSHKQNIF